MKALLLNLAVSVPVTVAAIAVHHHLFIRPLNTVGVVDVAEVYRLKEAEFTAILTRTGSDHDREQALVLARTFSRRLPAALAELSNECRCLIVVKAAVAGTSSHTMDLTAALRRKVDTP